MSAPVARDHVRQPAQRDRHARPNVVAERHGAQETHAVGAELLPGGQRGGHNRAPRMRLGERMRVIGLVGVSKHSIRKRGLDGTTHHIRANHGRNLLALVDARELDRETSRRKIGTRNHRRHSVEDYMLGLLDGLLRKFAAGRLAHIGTERRHDLACGRRHAFRSSRKCCGRQDRARTLQHFAPREDDRVRFRRHLVVLIILHGVFPRHVMNAGFSPRSVKPTPQVAVFIQRVARSRKANADTA